MGFTNIKRAAIEALRTGNFQSDPDGVRKGKNLLGTGEVSPAEVIALLERCRGPQYECSPHHLDPQLPVHVFKPETRAPRPGVRGVQWYIKLYFLEGEGAEPAIFMSVHTSTTRRG